MELKNLVNSRADELAAENNVTEQDGEIAARLGVLGLLVQHEAGDGHQVRSLSIGAVIHFQTSIQPSLAPMAASYLNLEGEIRRIMGPLFR